MHIDGFTIFLVFANPMLPLTAYRTIKYTLATRTALRRSLAFTTVTFYVHAQLFELGIFHAATGVAGVVAAVCVAHLFSVVVVVVEGFGLEVRKNRPNSKTLIIYANCEQLSRVFELGVRSSRA
jgi:hypothetical protein